VKLQLRCEQKPTRPRWWCRSRPRWRQKGKPRASEAEVAAVAATVAAAALAMARHTRAAADRVSRAAEVARLHLAETNAAIDRRIALQVSLAAAAVGATDPQVELADPR